MPPLTPRGWRAPHLLTIVCRRRRRRSAHFVPLQRGASGQRRWPNEGVAMPCRRAPPSHVTVPVIAPLHAVSVHGGDGAQGSGRYQRQRTRERRRGRRGGGATAYYVGKAGRTVPVASGRRRDREGASISLFFKFAPARKSPWYIYSLRVCSRYSFARAPALNLLLLLLLLLYCYYYYYYYYYYYIHTYTHNSRWHFKGDTGALFSESLRQIAPAAAPPDGSAERHSKLDPASSYFSSRPGRCVVRWSRGHFRKR